MSDDYRHGGSENCREGRLGKTRGVHWGLHQVDGGAVTVPLAKVWLHIGEYVIKHVVAVCKDPPQQALLGLDIGILDYLMQLEREQREQKEASKLSVNTTTRAQAKAREQQEQKDAELSARDLAQPTPIDSEPEVEAESREEIEDEPEIESEVEIAELDLEDVENEEIATEFEFGEELAEPIELETVEDSGEVIPLPTLDDNQQDKALLREQQQQDESLMSVRGWAGHGERGYGYQDGLLVHVCEGETGEQLIRVVVPECRRRKVLQVSHSCLTGDTFPTGKQRLPSIYMAWGVKRCKDLVQDMSRVSEGS